MNHFKHSDCNGVLGKGDFEPADVNDLNILRGHIATPSGLRQPVVVSFWKPDAKDIADIVAGKCIKLVIFGHTHAPLLLEVE